MTEKGPSNQHHENSALILVPADDSDLSNRLALIDDELMDDYLDVLSNQNPVRREYEERYSTELYHMRLAMNPRPDEEKYPDEFAAWNESCQYVDDLAQWDLRLASIVKRLATSINEKVNANQPMVRRRNRHGREIDQYGRDIWARSDEKTDETEFAEIEREVRAESGLTIPLNRFEAEDVLAILKDKMNGYHNDVSIYADLAYPARDYDEEAGSSEMWDKDGNVVKPTAERIRRDKEAYDAEVAVAEDSISQLTKLAERYAALSTRRPKS